MTKVYTLAELRQIEASEFTRRDSFAIMQQAGRAVARAVTKHCADKAATVAVVAGSGNNGGDALVAAAALWWQGYNGVQVFCTKPLRDSAADAQRAKQMWGEATAPGIVYTDLAAFISLTPVPAVVVDGLYGIGLNRAPDAADRAWIEAINAHRQRGAAVVAIDLPSGLHADSGKVLGNVAVRATTTISFFGDKLGLWTAAGRDCCGRVVVDDLEMNHAAAQNLGGRLIDGITPPHAFCRNADSHKGRYGNIALVGGSDGMLGALVLASRAAATMGAGKVFAQSTATHPPTVDWQHPEIMWHAATADLPAHTIVAGMGLGLDDANVALLHTLAGKPVPLLLDADALTLLARHDELKQAVCRCTHPTILTPHVGEAARLLDCDTDSITADRLHAARTIAASYCSIVVLKGAGTIVCAPASAKASGEQWGICAAGNAGLARGGSGDVLAGIIGASLLQISDPFAATCTAVWLHAAAADALAQQHGMVGVNINHIATTAATLASGKPTLKTTP